MLCGSLCFVLDISLNETLVKMVIISHTLYCKKQVKRYQQDPTRRENWQYDEMLDIYVDHRADKVQANGALDELARIKSGY